MSETKPLKAPFPYFGGKSRVANFIWRRLGAVPNYVEPFFGSGAVLLARPEPFAGTETVNDADGLVSNFWRAVRADPDAVAEHADWPVFENDLHARHAWLVGRKDSLQARLEGDPEFYDAKVAGWWCWGLCCWIGRGWCSGQGPWYVVEAEDGLPRLTGDARIGQEIRQSLPHLAHPVPDSNSQGVTRRPGVHRTRIHIAGANGGTGQGVTRASVHIPDVMQALSDRLCRVRVCCGDWSRVCTPTPTISQGLTAVFLDPPYSLEAARDKKIYRVENLEVAQAAREWALKWGDHQLMRICLAGFEGEHAMPSDWECVAWKAGGGYASPGPKGAVNAPRERLWFSPGCERLQGLSDADAEA